MSEVQKKTSDNDNKVSKWIDKGRIWVKENKKPTAIIVGAAVVLIGIGLGIGTLIGRSGGNQDNSQSSAMLETQTMTQTKTSESVAAEPLQENGYPEINDLMTKYYQALASGDMDTVQSIKDLDDDTEALLIQAKSEYLDAYNVVACYTKPGPDADSWVVYVAYDADFKDQDTHLPGLSTYVCRKTDGVYRLYDPDTDTELENYVHELRTQDDVVELFNKINVKYKEALTASEDLSAFIDGFQEQLKADVGDAIKEMEAALVAQETVTETESEEQADVQTQPSKVKTTEVVNVRKSDSQEAESLGKTTAGEEFVLLEAKGNGWSKIDYDGQEAYIKSEFLIAVEGDGASDEQAGNREDTDASSDTSGDTGTGNPAGEAVSANVPDSGSYRVTTTINVRKSASETADRMGVCYSGDTIEIIMKQADGWTKVKFNGKTGYVKTEVLK